MGNWQFGFIVVGFCFIIMKLIQITLTLREILECLV